MKKKKFEVTSIYFNVPLYGFDVLVIIGAKSKTDILGQFKLQKVEAKTAEDFIGNPNIDWLLKQDAGTVMPQDDLRLIYLFREWKDEWKWYEILVHEISHMVDDIAKYKNLVNETEARAYLTEYLFRTIRKALTK